MSPNKVVLISGANRGLGKAFLERYLARPNHTVIAANRDPEHESSKALLDLPKGANSLLHIVKIDATSDMDAGTAIQILQSQGVTHIDLVYANAGIAYVMPKVSELDIQDLRTHMETNVYGIVRLYQAVLPMLRQSRQPMWISIGGRSGYMNDFFAFPNAAFGVTKVVLHWLTLAIHHEEPTITAFVVNPGLVQTDMGMMGARIAAEYFQKPELTESILPIGVSVDGVIRVADAATRGTHSGKLWTYDAQSVEW